MKSSKTFCLFPSIPALCQPSPYSPPPRRFGMAMVPPDSRKTYIDDEKNGCSLMLKPPYPKRSTGVDPSFFRSFLWTTNIDTLVLSLDGYHTCSIVNGDGSIGSLTLAQSADLP